MLAKVLDLHRRAENPHAASAVAERILGITPDDLTALEVRALAHFARRQYPEAIETVERLSEIQPQELSWRTLHLSVLRRAGDDTASLLGR